MALALRKVDAIKAWRAALGPTNSLKAKAEAPQSIRAQFGTDGQNNAGHGSDSPESANRELRMIFPELCVPLRMSGRRSLSHPSAASASHR